MVDVVQEFVKRFNALAKPLLQHLPFTCRNNPWNDVKGNSALGARFFTIDRKSNTDAVKGYFRFFPFLRDAFTGRGA